MPGGVLSIGERVSAYEFITVIAKIKNDTVLSAPVERERRQFPIL
jgi:hypothetical protein